MAVCSVEQSVIVAVVPHTVGIAGNTGVLVGRVGIAGCGDGRALVVRVRFVASQDPEVLHNW
jgi:hypothetical protein